MGIGFVSIFGPTMDHTIKGLRNKFKNTPLEPYLPLVIEFFFGAGHREFENSILMETRKNLQGFITELLQLANLLRDLKNKKLKGRGWQIKSDEDLDYIYCYIESYFFQKSPDLYDILDQFGFDEYNPIAPPEWHQALEGFPSRENFDFEDIELDDNGVEVEDGYRHLSVYEIDYLIKTLKKYFRTVSEFHIDTDTTLANRFVEFMVKKGVPKTRPIFRCMYSALECFNGIPDDLRISHQKTISTKDPQSNYIKSIALRVK